jgi:7-cyano-7-deazaguanine synthase
MERGAVVLLSGGLDSATVLALARAEGLACHALSFDYGQRHRVELQAATRVARLLGARSHRTAHIDLRAFGGSALTADLDVPKDRAPDALGGDIPITYVPARNTIFLSFALGLAEVTGSRAIFFGANAVDYSGYPDCRPAFVDAFEALANLATRMGVSAARPEERVRVRAPLLHLTKADIVSAGTRLGVDYAQTWSCYDPAPAQDDGGPHGPWAACGRCDSCLLRRRGFAEAGVADPTRYAAG